MKLVISKEEINKIFDSCKESLPEVGKAPKKVLSTNFAHEFAKYINGNPNFLNEIKEQNIYLPAFIKIENPIVHLTLEMFHAHVLFFDWDNQIISINICPQNTPSFTIVKHDSLEDAKYEIRELIKEGWEK